MKNRISRSILEILICAAVGALIGVAFGFAF
jgi:hypothetical protein